MTPHRRMIHGLFILLREAKCRRDRVAEIVLESRIRAARVH